MRYAKWFLNHYYVHHKGKVYCLPKSYTTERLVFWREVRNNEAMDNKALNLDGLREMADMGVVIERLGFKPFMTVVEADSEGDV